MNDAEQWLTVGQVAALKGKCAATIREQFDAGLLTGMRTDRGHRLIDPASLEAPDGFTVSEAGRRLGRSADTIRRWYDAGLLTGHRDRAGRRRIDLVSIETVLREPTPPC